MNVLAVGYPFARSNNRATLAGPNTFFIVPKVWKIKKGKASYKTESDDHIVTTSAFFHHSDYPLIGGLLKGWMPLLPWYMWKLKRRNNIAIVFDAHEPNLLTTLYNGFFVKLLGLKHIVFSWQNVALLHRPLISLNLVFADGIVCGNHKCLALFRGVTGKPLAQIPLAGLNTEQFKLKIPRLVRDVVTFIFVGAIGYRKGIHTILEAFQKIQNARLIIVGSGEYEDKLTILPHVTRIPWVDHENLVKLLESADVFLYPSIAHKGWEEQFGYSMAEASLMELPVIATHTGSIDELVIDGTTGILVPEKDISALFHAMTELARNPEKRAALGRAGRSYISEHFSHAVIAKKYNDFFKTL